MTVFSVLDLSPVPEGATARDALNNTLDLARHAEAWGYRRFWLAEHHNMPGIASAATAVVIGQVAAATETIRVGAGGIMLPNHAPLMVAEAFGTLATLYPGPDRARARPGARHRHGDGAGAAALSRAGRQLSAGRGRADRLFRRCRARAAGAGGARAPGTHVPVWILGSSLFGAQLAAQLGLPYAFASHFAPGDLEPAIAVYRETFRPSPRLAEPRLMLAFNVFAAETDAEGRRLRSSMQQAFVNLRSGRPGPLPRPVEAWRRLIDPVMLAQVDRALACSATGVAGDGAPRARGVSGAPPAGRADPDRADPRPCRPAAVVRDRGGGAARHECRGRDGRRSAFRSVAWRSCREPSPRKA